VRPLLFEEVPNDEAARLYAKGVQQLSAAEQKRLQDNLMWRMLDVAVERKLPLLVHTGYSNTPAWADAQQLHNLVVSPRLKGLKIAFCHSNWPSEGPAMIMARTCRGAYFDMAWTPLLSAEIGRRILSEAIDLVPSNKILMGTDCGCAEMFLGTARLIRRILTDTLAQKVEEGQFGEDAAKRIARAILWENPNEFHGLTVE
jgi:predicted TIM-barrel fold metal-dependent hydrolase